MAVTLRKLEERVKVSRQAISAVLNNKSNCRVSPETRKRILDTAREMGYQSNFGYQIMCGKSTKTVAVILSSRRRKSEEFIQHLILQLTDELNNRGYAVYSSSNMSSHPDDNLHRIRELISRGVQHFIFIGTPYGCPEIEAEIIRQKKTYIGYNSMLKRNVDTNRIHGVEEIIRYLHGKTGGNFCLFMNNDEVRLQALRNQYPDLTENEIREKFIVALPKLDWNEASFPDKIFESGYRLTGQALAERPNLKGFFYVNDNYALGGAAYLHRHGMKVGRDFFVAGVNNDMAVRFHVLPISSIEYPLEKILQALIREADREESPYETIIKVKTHIRELQL